MFFYPFFFIVTINEMYIYFIVTFVISFKGFDDYYLNLRPRMANECQGQSENNVPHKSLPGKIVNCRNIWFREFWSQHHKCTFSQNASTEMTRCTGTEELKDYEQEGLVPFVGKIISLTHKNC